MAQVIDLMLLSGGKAKPTPAKPIPNPFKSQNVSDSDWRNWCDLRESHFEHLTDEQFVAEYAEANHLKPTKKKKKRGKSMASLSQQKIEPIRWAVEGVIPEGLVILAGKQKMGKSWLAMSLGFDVAGGKKTMGNFNTEKGDVLYFALEDSERRLHRRVLQIANGEEVPEGFQFDTELSPLHEGGLEEIEDWLIDHPGAKMVIIDVLGKVMPPSRPNQSDYERDYRVLSPLKKLGEKYGVAIIAVTHLTKSTRDDAFDQVSGSVGITAVADTTLLLNRIRNSDSGKLALTSRDIEEQEWQANFERKTGRWSLSAADRENPEDALAGLSSEIFGVLAGEGNPMTVAEITAGVGYEKDKIETVRVTLNRLVKNGVISKDKIGSSVKYAIPEPEQEESPSE